MANEKHIRILKQGVEAWNHWRRKEPEVIPDLYEANLNEAKLSGINLENANLSRVSFRNATLNRANFLNANLTFAKLTRANLSGSNFNGADLRTAVLFGADLSDSEMIEANLRGANLRNVNLSGGRLDRVNLAGVSLQRANLCNTILKEGLFGSAILQATIFGNTDLTDAVGLERCRHIGNSVLDHRTLVRSGNLPHQFLLGCGLPDTYIEYFPSLVNTSPIKFYSCFISYSSKNSEFAQKLYVDLQNKRIKCWFAPEDLKIGDKISIQIDESIRVYEKLLIILSKHSLASGWVEKEVEAALEQERLENRVILFPVRLDNSVMKVGSGWAADIRRTRNIGDFRNWKQSEIYQKGFFKLLRDLKTQG
ncbi:MAG: toll/interleukin-1 receptor domain-containing protein [Pyrinomonadaceae bacterium]